MSTNHVQVRNSDGSVSITIPLTITISLGAPVLGQIPVLNIGHPPIEEHGYCNLVNFGRKKLFVGINEGMGWFAYCHGCKTNRHLLLHIGNAPYYEWMAHCNVCNKVVHPPHDGQTVLALDQISNVDRIVQRDCPNDSFPRALKHV
jgi:hypothetical protein